MFDNINWTKLYYHNIMNISIIYTDCWIDYIGNTAHGSSSTQMCAIFFSLWEVSLTFSPPMYLRHFLSIWTLSDTLTPSQIHNSCAWTWQEDSLHCPNLSHCRLPWKSSDQCKTQSTIHPSAVSRGVYSVQLQKSHCNLCHVIIGFRCLPAPRMNQTIWDIWCGRKKCLFRATSEIYVSRQSLLSVTSFVNI